MEVPAPAMQNAVADDAATAVKPVTLDAAVLGRGRARTQ